MDLIAALPLRIFVFVFLFFSSYQLIRENAYVLAKETFFAFYFVEVLEIMKNFETSGEAIGKLLLIPGKGICTMVGHFLRYHYLLWKRKPMGNVGMANKER